MMNNELQEFSRSIPATFEPVKAPILPNKSVVDIAIDLKKRFYIKRENKVNKKLWLTLNLWENFHM